MTRNLDWKWIGIGVLIMLALYIAATVILVFALRPQLQSGATVEDLSAGQAVLLAIVNFLIFAVGGFIVGLKSAGRTILEPGISAAIAVIIGLLISGNFAIGNILAGGLIPFGAGVLGGWLGERRQGTAA